MPKRESVLLDLLDAGALLKEAAEQTAEVSLRESAALESRTCVQRAVTRVRAHATQRASSQAVSDADRVLRLQEALGKRARTPDRMLLQSPLSGQWNLETLNLLAGEEAAGSLALRRRRLVTAVVRSRLGLGRCRLAAVVRRRGLRLVRRRVRLLAVTGLVVMRG